MGGGGGYGRQKGKWVGKEINVNDETNTIMLMNITWLRIPTGRRLTSWPRAQNCDSLVTNATKN